MQGFPEHSAICNPMSQTESAFSASRFDDGDDEPPPIINHRKSRHSDDRRSPRKKTPALDKDTDEELLFDVPVTVPPPPPPPPPPGRESSLHKVLPSPRDLKSKSSRARHSFETPQQEPKEQSGCDPNSLPSSTKSERKKKKQTSVQSTSSHRPPRTPTQHAPAIAPSPQSPTEYGIGIESFHQIMMDNIDKETDLLIRRQGSFQIYQKSMKMKRHASDFENDPSKSGKSKSKTHEPHTRQHSSMRTKQDNHHNDVESIIKETMNDISSAAASTMRTLQSALGQTADSDNSTTPNNSTSNKHHSKFQQTSMACMSPDAGEVDSLSETKTTDSGKPSGQPKGRAPPQRNPLFRNSSGTEMMKRMSDALKKVVVDAAAAAAASAAGTKSDERNDRGGSRGGDTIGEAEDDGWGGVGNILANAVGWEGGDENDEDDDQRSRATYDTWDDENSVLRRLGSWGTVNSQFTAGTAGTGATFGTMGTYETEGQSIVGPVSAAVAAAAAAKASAVVGDHPPRNGDQLLVPGSHHLRQQQVLHDDNGNLIDPVLLEQVEKQKQKKKQRKAKGGRRKKVVKFDYPPIKSLRQYTRPDPEDLPKLFFTEDELDQIEDDRYSTMSADDIEIVAVSSKEQDSNSDFEPKHDYERGARPVKGRSGTPIRRRQGGNGRDRDDKPETQKEAQKSPRRLVKGVQIYLRERSTGTA